MANADVYVLVSQYDNGDRFEGDVMVKAYKTLADAQKEFQADKEEVMECFLGPYNKEDISVEGETDTHVLIVGGDYYDWCELTIKPLYFMNVV